MTKKADVSSNFLPRLLVTDHSSVEHGHHNSYVFHLQSLHRPFLLLLQLFTTSSLKHMSCRLKYLSTEAFHVMHICSILQILRQVVHFDTFLLVMRKPVRFEEIKVEGEDLIYPKLFNTLNVEARSILYRYSS